MSNWTAWSSYQRLAGAKQSYCKLEVHTDTQTLYTSPNNLGTSMSWIVVLGNEKNVPMWV